MFGYMKKRKHLIHLSNLIYSSEVLKKINLTTQHSKLKILFTSQAIQKFYFRNVQILMDKYLPRTPATPLSLGTGFAAVEKIKTI